MSTPTSIVNRAYEAFAAGDIPTVIGLLAPDVEWVSPRTLPHGGDYHGRAGATEFFTNLGHAWETLTLRVDHVSDLDDGQVIGVAQATGRLRTGTTTGYAVTHLFAVRDGEITSFHEFTDLDGPIVAS